MNNTLRNILAVIAGVVVGSAVNMGIVVLSSSIIPLPEGVDATSVESLKANIHLFEPKHFLFPFLAHAIGTLAGAYVAARIAGSYKFVFAMVIGAWFLLGGIANLFMLPTPTWFILVDLLGAYIPMAWLGARLAGAKMSWSK